jgi:hypothetical protein
MDCLRFYSREASPLNLEKCSIESYEITNNSKINAIGKLRRPHVMDFCGGDAPF